MVRCTHVRVNDVALYGSPTLLTSIGSRAKSCLISEAVKSHCYHAGRRRYYGYRRAGSDPIFVSPSRRFVVVELDSVIVVIVFVQVHSGNNRCRSTLCVLHRTLFEKRSQGRYGIKSR